MFRIFLYCYILYSGVVFAQKSAITIHHKNPKFIAAKASFGSVVRFG